MYSPDLPLDAFDLSVETVRGRFAWAERRGERRWLWPDVAVADWRTALDRIEDVLRERLAGYAIAALDCEPAALGIAAYTSGTGPLLGHWLERGLITAPADCAQVLAYQLRHNRLRMERLTKRAQTLVGRLARAGIAVTVIKGMHTAHAYFPEAGARPVSDIDFVIAPVDRLAAGTILAQSDYLRGRCFAGPPAQEEWRPAGQRDTPRTLAFVHFDDPWTVDLQTSHDRRFGPGRTAHVDAALPARDLPPWPCARGARVLPQPWLLLSLVLHTGANWETFSMIRLAELAMVVRSDTSAGRLDWDAFTGAVEQVDGAALVYPALHHTEGLAPGSVPMAILARFRACTPRSTREVIEGLRPATAQRLLSLRRGEKFVWAPTPLTKAWQLLGEIVPRESASLADFARIYRRRAWKLARQTVFR
jgi:hypothetical protein